MAMRARRGMANLNLSENGRSLAGIKNRGLTLRFPLKYALRTNRLYIKKRMHGADMNSISVTKRRWRRTMHAKKIIDEILSDCLQCLHAKQAEGVKVAVCGALGGGRLSLSQLARSVESATTMRHRVKRIDRLLGNEALHTARASICCGGVRIKVLVEIKRQPAGPNSHPTDDWRAGRAG